MTQLNLSLPTVQITCCAGDLPARMTVLDMSVQLTNLIVSVGSVVAMPDLRTRPGPSRFQSDHHANAWWASV